MRGKIVRAAHSGNSEGCEYSVLRRRTSFELVVECGDCSAEPGLHSPKCFRNVVKHIQQEGMPIAITLRSHVERRYGPGATGTVGQISGILNRIESLQGQLARDSAKGSGCADCTHQLAVKLAVIGQGLASMDMDGALTSTAALEAHVLPSRPACLDCTGLTNVQIHDILSSVQNLKKSLVRGAFNVVEAEA